MKVYVKNAADLFSSGPDIILEYLPLSWYRHYGMSLQNPNFIISSVKDHATIRPCLTPSLAFQACCHIDFLYIFKAVIPSLHFKKHYIPLAFMGR